MAGFLTRRTGCRQTVGLVTRTAVWLVLFGAIVAPPQLSAQGIETVLTKVKRLQDAMATLVEAPGADVTGIEASIASLVTAYRNDLARLDANMDHQQLDAEGVNASQAALARIEEATATMRSSLVRAEETSKSLHSLASIVAELSRAVALLSEQGAEHHDSAVQSTPVDQTAAPDHHTAPAHDPAGGHAAAPTHDTAPAHDPAGGHAAAPTHDTAPAHDPAGGHAAAPAHETAPAHDSAEGHAAVPAHDTAPAHDPTEGHAAAPAHDTAPAHDPAEGHAAAPAHGSPATEAQAGHGTPPAEAEAGHDTPPTNAQPAGDQPGIPQAVPVPVIGGSVRLRGEMKSHFKFGAHEPGDTEDYGLSQLRVNAKWQPTPGVTFYVEGQDARIFGEEAINENAVPNIFADDLDLHQATLKLETLVGRSDVPVALTVGRQKFNMGGQRLIASLEWVNTARVWDGVRVDVGTTKDRTLSAFASRLVPVNPNGLNGHEMTPSRMFNSYFHGIYYTDWNLIPGGQIEGYWLLRDQGDAHDFVNTAGYRLKVVRGPLDWEMETAVQWGTYDHNPHAATMFSSGVGFTPATLNGARFGVAYSYGSGDNDPDDHHHGTFDNQFPLNHAYYGSMDFFSLQNVHNAEASFSAPVGAGVALRMAYQGFWLVNPETDAWYNAGGGVIRQAEAPAPAVGHYVGGGRETPTVGHYVGSEFDITLKRSFLDKRFLVEAGYGRFLAGGYVADTGPSMDADFFYLQTKIIR